MIAHLESSFDDLLAGLRGARRELERIPMTDLLQVDEPFPNLETPTIVGHQPVVNIPLPPRMVRRTKPHAYRAGFIRLAEPLLFSLSDLPVDDD